jgi:hypothetical protein
MNDLEIKELVSNLPTSVVSELTLKYKGPIALGSGHTIELESKKCLGTISVWAFGMMDWHIFDIETSKETLLGHSEAHDAYAVLDTLFMLFEQIRKHDNA